MTPRHTADWMALSLLPGLGPTSLNRLLEHYPDPHEIALNLPAHILSAGTRGARAAAIHSARRDLRRKVDEELRRAPALGPKVLVYRLKMAYLPALSAYFYWSLVCYLTI